MRFCALSLSLRSLRSESFGERPEIARRAVAKPTCACGQLEAPRRGENVARSLFWGQPDSVLEILRRATRGRPGGCTGGRRGSVADSQADAPRRGRRTLGGARRASGGRPASFSEKSPGKPTHAHKTCVWPSRSSGVRASEARPPHEASGRRLGCAGARRGRLTMKAAPGEPRPVSTWPDCCSEAPPRLSRMPA